MHQCCRFQSYAKSRRLHAVAHEIDKRNLQSVNDIPAIHDKGRVVTSDFNSVLKHITWFTLRWFNRLTDSIELFMWYSQYRKWKCSHHLLWQNDIQLALIINKSYLIISIKRHRENVPQVLCHICLGNCLYIEFKDMTKFCLILKACSCHVTVLGDFCNVFKFHAYSVNKGCSWWPQSLLVLTQPSNS